jgi:hypothetical protein
MGLPWVRLDTQKTLAQTIFRAISAIESKRPGAVSPARGDGQTYERGSTK